MAPRDDDLAHWTRRHFCEVPAAKAGQRLDAFLARSFPYRSRTSWAAFVRAGEFGSTRPLHAPAGRSAEGTVSSTPRPSARAASVSRAYRIIHEDELVLAIRKPANLPSILPDVTSATPCC